MPWTKVKGQSARQILRPVLASPVIHRSPDMSKPIQSDKARVKALEVQLTGLTDQNSRLERRVTSLMDMVDALNKRTQEMVVKPVKPVKQEKSKVPVRVPIKAPVKIPVKIPARRKKNA